MLSLHAALTDYIEKVPVQVLSKIIERQIQSQNVTLTQDQLTELTEMIIANDGKAIDFPSSSYNNHTLRVDLSDDAREEFLNMLDEFHNNLEPFLMDLADNSMETLLAILRSKWTNQEKLEDKFRKKFNKNLHVRWGQAISKLKMLLSISREFGTELNANTSEHNSPHLNSVLFMLHARGCQVTEEIIVLLSQGFSDGAMARWRTLHEIAVISTFISKAGEEVAERYLLHEAIASRRAAAEYTECQSALGYPPLQDGSVHEIIACCNQLIKRFGPTYRHPYGWASTHLQIEKPTFKDVEKAAGIAHLRAHYGMASYNVHANAKGVLFKLGIIGEPKVLLAGPSNAGLADPGHGTAISLVQVTAPLITISPNLDSIVTLKLLTSIENEVGKLFIEAHGQLAKDSNNATIGRQSGSSSE